MKKAVVFYLWGKKNAGDMAICLGTVSLLQDLGYEITFVSRFASGEIDYKESKEYIDSYHKNVNVKPGLFQFDREETKIKRVFSYLSGIAKLISPKDDQRLRDIISNADVIFLNGGNILRGNSVTDYARLAALFYPFRIAERLNKPMVCLPQSTAESTTFGINILKRKLSNFNKVFIRESHSFSVLNKNIKGVPLVQSVDTCFFIKDVPKAFDRFKHKYSSFVNSSENNIAIVLRSTTIGDLGEFSDSKKEKLTNEMVNFVNFYKENYNIYFVVQTKKDKEFTQYVKDQVDDKAGIKLIEEYDAYIIREVYRKMQFVVTMRLHAAILSMTAETPVLGYFEEEWGLKNPGIMDDVGMIWTNDGSKLVNYVKELELNREELVTKINNYIESEKGNIRDKLH